MAVLTQKDPIIAELMSDKEAAKYLKLSSKFGYMTIQKWAREGVLKAGRVGEGTRTKYLFRKRDLDDYIFSKK